MRERFENLPRKLNIFRMWANAATCFVPGMRFGGAILSKQKLDPALRELIILWVARLEGGTYEWVQHVPIGEAAGCRKDQIKALEEARIDGAEFDAKEKVLLQFSREVVKDVRASEAAVAEMSKHFSPAGNRRSHPHLRLLHDHGAHDGNHARRCRCAGRFDAGR